MRYYANDLRPILRRHDSVYAPDFLVARVSAMKRFRLFCLVTSTLICAGAAAATPDWVIQSNKNAQLLLDVQGSFNPEFAARNGLTGYDDKTVDLGPNVDQRSREATKKVKAELEKRLTTETEVHVRQDLEIMINATALRIESTSSAVRFA